MIQRVPEECLEVGVCVLFITSEEEAKEEWENCSRKGFRGKKLRRKIDTRLTHPRL